MKSFFKTLLIFGFIITSIYANDININQKIKEAKKQNKQIMMFFHIPRCPYCDRMLDKNFKEPKILDLIKNSFILIDIYTADKRKVIFKEFKGTTKEFAELIGTSAYPATIFMDQNSKVTYKSIGYRNIQEYINEIKYIATKSYKKIKLETFIINLEMEEDDE